MSRVPCLDGFFIWDSQLQLSGMQGSHLVLAGIVDGGGIRAPRNDGRVSIVLRSQPPRLEVCTSRNRLSPVREYDGMACVLQLACSACRKLISPLTCVQVSAAALLSLNQSLPHCEPLQVYTPWYTTCWIYSL